MDRVATRSRHLQASRPWGLRLQLRRRQNLGCERVQRKFEKLVIVVEEWRDRFGELLEVYAHVLSSMAELARDARARRPDSG